MNDCCESPSDLPNLTQNVGSWVRDGQKTGYWGRTKLRDQGRAGKLDTEFPHVSAVDFRQEPVEGMSAIARLKY